MKPIQTAARQTLNKAGLALCRQVYKKSDGKYPRTAFSAAVKPAGLKTDVRIIREDETSTTIAKVDERGRIQNNGFRILSTTDLHLEQDAEKNITTLQKLADNILDTKPDLVLLTGDVVLTKYQQIDAIQFAQFMEMNGVYWAIIFGNHETREEKGFYKYLMLKSMCEFPHCLSKLGSDKLYGYGNFIINIMNGKNSLSQSLFFLDSGRDIRDEYRAQHGVPEGMTGYDFIKQNQIDWYCAELAAIRERYGETKSMMYMHIPLKEYEYVIEPDGHDGFRLSGKCHVLYGDAFESVGSSPFNSGMFDTILHEGSTQAVFCGHDHVNDFCAIYQGVYLVYSQCAGYDGYTMGSKFGLPESEWQQGVTITDIAPDGSVEISQRLNARFL